MKSMYVFILFAGIHAASAQIIPDPTATIPLTSSPPYSVIGELYISKADTNAPGLRNPILVAEGFDADNNMNWETLYTLMNREQLIEDLQAYGRDLIILNFGDATADIIANCALTESAINYVNSNRWDMTDKFTAVGVSLGGMTMRKALVDLPNHDVDTWISFDAPHEGANIPLGLQEFLEHFSTIPLADFDLIRQSLAILDRPASRQLLLVHHSHTDGLAGGSIPLRDDFVSEMNTTGYPTNCKRIAISNGSGFGEKLPFDPGQLIIHWHHDGPFLIGPDIDADIHALPELVSGRVYSGDFTALIGNIPAKTVNAYLPYSLDNAPGGYRSSFYSFFTNLPAAYIDGDDYCAYPNHCFVPTVSALGIPIGNIESNLSTHAAITALSPFDEIHYALTNEEHVAINTHNKRWLLRAALEDHDSDGDGFDDYQEYLVGTAYDSASSYLTVEAVMEVQLANEVAALSWAAFTNTQYEVWFSEELDIPWQLLETIAPTNLTNIDREYSIETSAPSGFFKISASPVDPVTD